MSREQHVVWFDVPVHDSIGVRICQRIDDIAQDASDVRHRQLVLSRQARTERLAGDVWHGVVEQPVRRRRGEHGDDVRVLETGRQVDLALEAVGAETGRKIGGKDLDDNPPIERGVMHEEHTRHASAAELALDAERWAKAYLEPLLEVGDTVPRARAVQNVGRGVPGTPARE